MKPSSRYVFSLRALMPTAVVFTMSLAATAFGQSSWNSDTSGNWSDATKWSAGIPSGAGAVAQLNFNITGTRTITIDTTSRIVGTLTIGDTNRTNSYTVNASGGGTLTFNNNALGANLTASTTSLSDTVSAPIILEDSLTISNLNSTAAGGTARTLTVSGAISAGSGARVITVSGASALANVSLSGAITNGGGSVSVVKSSSNILSLSGANTYTGGVTLNAGTLNLNSTTALGAAAGTFTIAGGTIGNTSVAAGSTLTLANNNAQIWSGDFTFGGTRNLNLGTGNVTLTGNRTIALAASGASGVITELTVGGAISDGGSGYSLTTTNASGGAGISAVLRLTGTNTYTGGTIINGGLVRFITASAIPTTGSILIGPNGALSVAGAYTTLAGWIGSNKISTASTGALALLGNSSENFNPGASGHNTLSLGADLASTVVYTGTITPAGTSYFVGGGGGSIEFSNADAFTGTADVVVGNGGGGRTIISNANTYTGTTSVGAGTVLSVRNSAALGSSAAGTTVAAGGSVELQSNVAVVGEALTLNGTNSGSSANNNISGLTNVSGDNSWSGNITANFTSGNNVRITTNSGTLAITGNVAMAGNTAQSLVLTGPAGTGTISGVISGITGQGQAIIKNGNGAWVLSGQNTFAGGVRIDGGSLSAATLNSVVGGTASSNLGAPTSAANGVISFGETTNTGTLIYTGSGETTDRGITLRSIDTTAAGGGIIDQSGTGLLKFTGNVTSASTALTKNLTLQGSTSGTGEMAGVIANSSTGATSLTKAGSGTWTLSGTNTYTGATTVNGGALIVSGGINSSTAIAVTGGTLALGKTNVLNDAAAVNLGNGAVLQTAGFSDVLGALTVSGNAILDLSLGDSTLTFGSLTSITGTLSVTGWTGLETGGGAEQFIIGGTPLTTAQLAQITFTDNTGTYSALQLASGEIVRGLVIPEPSVLLLGAFGSLGLVLRRRRL